MRKMSLRAPFSLSLRGAEGDVAIQMKGALNA
jgi:hypothetical protein